MHRPSARVYAAHIRGIGRRWQNWLKFMAFLIVIAIAIAITELFIYHASPKVSRLSPTELRSLVGDFAIDSNGALTAKIHNGTDKRVEEIVAEITVFPPDIPELDQNDVEIDGTTSSRSPDQLIAQPGKGSNQLTPREGDEALHGGEFVRNYRMETSGRRVSKRL